MGEVAAAYISGNISLDEAACIITTRSSLMKRMAGKGAMGYIAVAPDEARKMMEGLEDKLSLGVNNSPASCVISGEPEAVDTLLAKAEAQGYFSRRVNVDVASHSPQMDPLLQELKKALTNIRPRSTETNFFSTVTASLLPGDRLNHQYWADNLRSTVRFSETIQLMAKDGYGHFVEMSPHPTLLQAIHENSEAMEDYLIATGSLERKKDESFTLLKNLADYYAKGGRINWKKFYGTDYQRIILPAYPFQRERYWVESSDQPVQPGIGRRKTSKTAHPFLMQQVDTPEGSGLHIWESTISTALFPYLSDHKVQDAVVVPGAAYIEILFAVANEMAGAGKHLLKKVALKRALPLKDQESKLIQIVLQHRIADTYDAFIYSLEGESSEEEWMENATAILQINSSTERLLPNALPVDIIERTVGETITAEQHYQFTNNISLPYGPVFQTISKIRLGENFILADVSISQKARFSASKYLLHPSVLDGCIQAYLSAIYRDANKGTFVPVSARTIALHHYGKSIEQCTAAIKITAESRNHITGNAVVYSPSGEVILEMRDFTLERLEQTADQTEILSELLYEVAIIPAELPERKEKKILLFSPENDNLSLHTTLQPVFIVKKGNQFERTGNSITIDPNKKEHYLQLQEMVSGEIDTVVHAWSLDEKYVAGLSAQQCTTLSVAKIIQTFNNDDNRLRLWVISGDVAKYPAMAPVAGMLHVLRNEHPEWQPSHVEILFNNADALTNIIHSDTPEMQWQIGESVGVARMQHPGEAPVITSKSISVPAGDSPFEAVMDEPGILDNIIFREKELPAPAPHEVQISVKAIGINFMNLMSALGIYPGKENGFATLGIECAGVVTAVGSDVQHLKVGDKVFGMAYHTMASHILVDASLMRKIPEGMDFEDAATIPVVFLTVYYSLITLGRLQKGERVLIHAATGGVGLAAIQVAQHIGAEIFATAGSKAKRDMLREMGIEHVYDSRTSDFADRIMRDTSGEGIDVVLNSLTGDAMLESLHLLRSFGRFIEIGKKDVYADSKIGLKAFSKGLSYFMVDFEKMIFEKPAYVGELLEEMLPYFEKGIYQPLSKKTFPVAQAREAFAYMSSGQHTGKIVISISPENVLLEKKASTGFPVRESATYLLTGGYGGLGLTFATYLVNRGATSLILTGRSGPSENAQHQIDFLIARGVDVRIEKMDAGNADDIHRVISSIPEDKPLKGVFHLAGLLEDASLMNLNEDAFYRVLHPKVAGAYLLHEATREMSLDHFVLFSSSTILFGSPGQTAYVAANSYMDALAAYRKKNGLSALSIQWGTVSDVGLAAAAGNRAERLAEEGVAPLTPEECPLLLEMAAKYDNPVMGAFRFDISKWESYYPAAAKNPLYALLRTSTGNATSEESTAEQSFTELLNTIADPEQRLLSLEDKLREKVGLVVKLSPDQISNKTPFKSLGIDSLMSIQLKNQLEKTFNTAISVTSFWTHSNIRDYARFLMDKLQLSAKEEEKPAALKVSEPVSVLQPAEMDLPDEDVSLDDLSKLLEDELSDL
jgi:NADPH:quinone reductase-like Zn-dependent oxidoreductase/NAD(P)-dependent dehydrogenase (short-subunit alcohol dehydrogenase family)/acyl carrier protein